MLRNTQTHTTQLTPHSAGQRRLVCETLDTRGSWGTLITVLYVFKRKTVCTENRVRQPPSVYALITALITDQSFSDLNYYSVCFDYNQ